MEELELLKKLVELAEKYDAKVEVHSKKNKSKKKDTIVDLVEDFAHNAATYVDTKDKDERRVALSLMLCAIYRELLEMMKQCKCGDCKCCDCKDCKCEK